MKPLQIYIQLHFICNLVISLRYCRSFFLNSIDFMGMTDITLVRRIVSLYLVFMSKALGHRLSSIQ